MNEVLVVFQVVVGNAPHEPDLVEGDMFVAAAQSHHHCLLVGGGGHGHVLKGDVIGAVEGDGGVGGVPRIVGHGHLLAVGPHASKGDRVGLAGAFDFLKDDILVIRSWSDFKKDRSRHALREQVIGGSAKRGVRRVLGGVGVDGVGA